jgi:hypothetical protein
MSEVEVCGLVVRWFEAYEDVSVPDSGRRIIPEVVLVKARGSWGSGNLEGGWVGKGWNKGGQFASNLRLRWTDPVTTRRVPSK